MKRETLNLEILNGNRGDIPGKKTFVANTGASVINYILCTYSVGRCVKTFRVREMGISDHNMVEAMIEVNAIMGKRLSTEVNSYRCTNGMKERGAISNKEGTRK
jgi:hypothetical protein